MQKFKMPNKLKWKYRTIKIFIICICIALLASLSIAFCLYRTGNDFGYSVCLNIFGGLTTGLIILAYTYMSNKNLKNATDIVDKLKEVEVLSSYYANELDFCTDINRPSEEQMQDHGIELETILEDNEGCAYALQTYKDYLNNLNLQFDEIKHFLEQDLFLPLDFHSYKEELDGTIEFFSEYQIEDRYEIPPYLVRKYSNDDFIHIYNNMEEAEQYIKDIAGTGNNNYYIDPPDNMYEVSCVFKQNAEVFVADVYKEWIVKMNTLYDKTEQFNSEFVKYRKSICAYHNKNTNIVH